MDSVTDDRFLICRVSPFGNLRIDAYVPLPEAYRSLSRPSSAPDAKAFPLRSFSLNLRRCKLRSFRFRVRPCGLPRKIHIASLHLLSETKRRFVSVLISGSLNYAGSYRISSTKLFYPFSSSTIASEFPSVALLVFPLFSFQCAVVASCGSDARACTL